MNRRYQIVLVHGHRSACLIHISTDFASDLCNLLPKLIPQIQG